LSQQEECPGGSGWVARKRPAWQLAGLALFALLVGVAVVACGATGQQGSEDDPSGDDEQATAALEHPSLGDEDAPVVMTEYADYQ
jgi:protein-disulfide isomerase